MTASPLSPRNLVVAAVLAGTLIAGAAYLVFAGGGDNGGAPSTPDAFLARVESALEEQGEIPHVTGESTVTRDGVTEPLWFIEVWYDFDSGSVRSSVRKAPGNQLDLPDEVVELRQDDDVYTMTPGTGDPTQARSASEAPACFDR